MAGFFSMAKLLKRRNAKPAQPLAPSFQPLPDQGAAGATQAEPPAAPVLNLGGFAPLPKKKGFKTMGPTAERLQTEGAHREMPRDINEMASPAGAAVQADSPAGAAVQIDSPAKAAVQIDSPVIAAAAVAEDKAASPIAATAPINGEAAPAVQLRTGIRSSASVGLPFSMTPLKNPTPAAKLPPLRPEPLATPDNGEEFVSRPAPPNVPLKTEGGEGGSAPEPAALSPAPPLAAIGKNGAAPSATPAAEDGSVHPNNFFIRGVNDEALQEKPPKASAFGSAPSSAPIVNPGGFTSAMVVEEKSEESMPVAPSAHGGAAMPPLPGKIAAAPGNFFGQETVGGQPSDRRENLAPDAGETPRFRLVAVAEVEEEEAPIVLPSLDPEYEVGLPFGMDKNERVARPAADFPVMEPLPEGTVIEKRAVPFRIKARAFTERPQDRQRRAK